MPKSFPCDYTGTLQAHTEAHTACLTGCYNVRLTQEFDLCTGLIWVL